MIITEDLARCGLVHGPMWPKPEILNGANEKYLFSCVRPTEEYPWVHTIHKDTDIRDVYLVRGGHDDVDSLVFACDWSTRNRTYGSTPLFSFLESVNSLSCPSIYRAMMCIMLSLGRFSFTMKDVKQ